MKKYDWLITARLRYRRKIITFIIVSIISAVAVRCMAIGDGESILTCILTLFLLTAPLLAESAFRISLSDTFVSVYMCFVFSANILGEVASFYTRIAFWDTLLHTVSGFLCAAAGFGFADIQKRRTEAERLSPVFIFLFSFCFSMTAGVIWEFTEFAVDALFGRDMQKDTVIHSIHTVLLSGERNAVSTIDNITSASANSTELGVGGYIDIGLIDTVKDLFANLIGALVFIITGALSFRGNKKAASLVAKFTPKKCRR